MNTHTRPFKCAVQSCSYHRRGFGAQKELDRHEDTIHRLRGLTRFLCPDPYCKFARPEKGFPKTRRDNFLRHVNSQHSNLFSWTKDNLEKLEFHPDS